MNVLLNIILITSIWCLGVTIVTQPDMALGSVRAWAETKKSKWFEPLILCEWCLPSIHSLFGYLFSYGIGIIHDFNLKMIAMYPIVVMGASIVTGVSWSIYEAIFQFKEYFKKLNNGS